MIHMPAWCWQAFGALTHALTTTIKNNTTGRPLSNVEVVSSVRCCLGKHTGRHHAVASHRCPTIPLMRLIIPACLQVRHFLAAGGFQQNPCLSCSERNANASFII